MAPGASIYKEGMPSPQLDVDEGKDGSILQDIELRVTVDQTAHTLRAGFRWSPSLGNFSYDTARSEFSMAMRSGQHAPGRTIIVSPREVDELEQLFFHEMLGPRIIDRLDSLLNDYPMAPIHSPVNQSTAVRADELSRKPDYDDRLANYFALMASLGHSQPWRSPRVAEVYHILYQYHLARQYGELYAAVSHGDAALLRAMQQYGIEPSYNAYDGPLWHSFIASLLGVSAASLTAVLEQGNCVTLLVDQLGVGVIPLLDHITIRELTKFGPEVARLAVQVLAQTIRPILPVFRSLGSAIVRPLLIGAELRLKRVFNDASLTFTEQFGICVE